jgi:hypothetical protein
MSYELGIPGRQYRRTTQVLRHEGTEPIEYEELKQDDGFYIFSFPEADEYDFKDIIRLLKTNGITTIGADTELEKAYDLKESKIMKLTGLINEQESPDENEIIDSLKKILERWEDPQYRGGGEELTSCPRSDHYFEDIRELVEDYTENFYLDLEDTDDVGGEEIYESKLKLKDFFINENEEQPVEDIEWLLRGEIFGRPGDYKEGTISKDSHSSLDSYHNLVKWLKDNNQEGSVEGILKDEIINFKLLGNEDVEWNRVPRGDSSDSEFKEEKVEIEIPGIEEKTEVKIKHKDSTDDSALKGVTIEFNGNTYSDIDFEAEEMIEDHENEGQDWVFISEGDDMMFEVEVQVEASYQESGNIQQIDWDTLVVTFGDKGEPLDEQGCTEQEIAEGTCGYGVDGEIGDKPAGPHLIAIIKENLRRLKK